MGLRIVLSSAVVLEEKKRVRERLEEMAGRNKICIDKIYDCAARETMVSGGDMGCSKQEEIDRDEIGRAQWFICLAAGATVGEATARELKLAANLLRSGANIVITVMHDHTQPAPEQMPAGRVLVSDLMEEVSAILSNADGTPAKQYHRQYAYSDDYSTLQDAIEEEYELLWKNNRFYNQHLDYYTCAGRDVEASELYFDKNRAKPRYGFRPHFYIPRASVDEQLSEAIDNNTLSFVFLTGRPGSGKTRAVYQMLHNELADSRIAVMRQENAADIARALIVSANNDSRAIGLDKNFHNTDYYFVCDQVADVLQGMDAGLQTLFLKTLCKYDNCKLIGTSTMQVLDNLKRESKIIEEVRNNNTNNARTIVIPRLSDDNDRDNILSMLRAEGDKQCGETIGDFIKELNEYKFSIAGSIVEKADSDEVPYLADLLHAIQLVSTFRHTTPLFLAVMILRNMHKKEDEEVFTAKCMEAVNYLVDKNALWINGMKNRTLLAPEDFDYDDSDIYDKERFDNIIPVRYLFTVNEIVWEVLEETERRNLYDDNSHHALFYNMADERGLKRAMKVFYSTFGSVSSLRRILPRIPDTSDEMLAVAYGFAHSEALKIDVSAENLAEMQLLYGMLLSRSRSIEEVESLHREIVGRGMEINNALIAEMYSFALRQLSNDKEAFDRYVNDIREYDRTLGLPMTSDFFFKAGNEIRIFYSDFGSAYGFVCDLLEKMGWDAVHRLVADEDSLDRANVEKLLLQLHYLCKTMDDVVRMAELYRTLNILPSKGACYSMAGIAIKTHENQDCLLSLFFKNDDDISTSGNLCEMLILCMIMRSRSFADSVRLYKLYCSKCGLGEQHIKLISLVVNPTRDWEFQEAVSFVYNETKGAPNHILINKLMDLAPSTDDALYFLPELKYVQNYALSNILKKLSKQNGENEQKKNKRFLNAYEIIHHPKFRNMRDDHYILNYLYEYCNNKWQEQYVDECIVKKNGYHKVLANKALVSVKIKKQYRSFAETFWEVYKSAVSEMNAISGKGKMEPDIYNSMISKYMNELSGKTEFGGDPETGRKLFDNLLKDIDRAVEDGRLIVDEELVFNRYVKAGNNDLFTADDSALALWFIEYVFRRKGEANFNSLKIWSKLIKYIASDGRIDNAIREKRCMTLYNFYCSQYAARSHKLIPNADLYAGLLNAVVSADSAAVVDRDIKRFGTGMNGVLVRRIENVEKRTGYAFTCDRKFVHNIHRSRIEEIKDATNYKDVLALLEAEYRDFNIVLPSMFNAAIGSLCDKSGWRANEAVYMAVSEFVRKNNLTAAINAKTHIYMALLAPDKGTLKYELDCIDKCIDRCDSELWRLAVNRAVWDLDQKRCRGYFHRWLSMYGEIYPSREAMIDKGMDADFVKNIRKFFRLDEEFLDYAERLEPHITDCVYRNHSKQSLQYDDIRPLLLCYKKYVDGIVS